MVIWMLVPIALIVGLVYLLRPRGTTAGSEPTDHALETSASSTRAARSTTRSTKPGESVSPEWRSYPPPR